MISLKGFTRGFIATVLLALAGVSVAQAGIFRALFSGSQDSFTLSAVLPAYCGGKRVYVVGITRSGEAATYVAFTSVNAPVVFDLNAAIQGLAEIPEYTAARASDGSIPILASFNVTPYPGGEIWVGCGTSTVDVLANSRYGRILVVSISWWPSQRSPNVGDTSQGPQQIPNDAVYVGDWGWQRAVINGLVPFLASGVELTGYTTRAIRFAFYISASNTSCMKMIYEDDGSAVGFPNTSGGECFTNRISWATGTDDGYIAFSPDFQGGVCAHYTWNESRLTLVGQRIVCPPDFLQMHSPDTLPASRVCFLFTQIVAHNLRCKRDDILFM
ncbi:MAG: hypothetical protein Q7S01_01480 [bacterium]|nr:hypothetical protein [bacterium]